MLSTKSLLSLQLIAPEGIIKAFQDRDMLRTSILSTSSLLVQWSIEDLLKADTSQLISNAHYSAHLRNDTCYCDTFVCLPVLSKIWCCRYEDGSDQAESRLPQRRQSLRRKLQGLVERGKETTRSQVSGTVKETNRPAVDLYENPGNAVYEIS